MKKALFSLAIIFVISFTSVSCSTDDLDQEMENSVQNTQVNADGELSTDPIVIPKRD